MRRGLLLLALLGLIAYQAPRAQANCAGTNTLNAFAAETITVSSTSIGFSAGNYEGQGDAASALVSVETNAIRFFSNGSTPTASVGHPVTAASTIEVCGISNIKRFRMIRQTSDATITVSYFK